MPGECGEGSNRNLNISGLSRGRCGCLLVGKRIGGREFCGFHNLSIKDSAENSMKEWRMVQ